MVCQEENFSFLFFTIFFSAFQYIFNVGDIGGKVLFVGTLVKLFKKFFQALRGQSVDIRKNGVIHNTTPLYRIWGLYPLNILDYNPHNKWCQGGMHMICFDRLWKTMEQKNISTYQLRERCGIDSKTVRRLKANDNMETKTLNKLCAFLNCQLDEIAEFVPDDK